MEDVPSQKKPRDLTPGAIDKLLKRLDPDQKRAGEEYENIRRKLIKFFEFKGCSSAEEHADKAIDRVAKKVDEGVEIQNVAAYALGVARYVFLEYLQYRKKEPKSIEKLSKSKHLSEDAEISEDPRKMDAELESQTQEEQRVDCMRKCFQGLDPEGRDLIKQYNQGAGRDRKQSRKRLAKERNQTENALRMKVFHIKTRLKKCYDDCIKLLPKD